jgi:hypothetical protein
MALVGAHACECLCIGAAGRHSAAVQSVTKSAVTAGRAGQAVLCILCVQVQHMPKEQRKDSLMCDTFFNKAQLRLSRSAALPLSPVPRTSPVPLM